jgi:hypothetical protein
MIDMLDMLGMSDMLGMLLNNRDKVVWIELSKQMGWEKKSNRKHPRRRGRPRPGPRWEQQFRVAVIQLEGRRLCGEELSKTLTDGETWLVEEIMGRSCDMFMF